MAHPFLAGVREGTLDPARFRRWLAQDRLFVEGGLPFLGALATGAPDRLRDLLAGASTAYREELVRFDALSRDLGVEPAPIAFVTHAYLQYLLATALRERPAGLVCLAVLERAYLEAWRGVAGGLAPDSPWRPLITQWTTDDFAGYVSELADAVDRFAVPASPRDALERHVDLTIAYELAFWEMAWHGWTWPG